MARMMTLRVFIGAGLMLGLTAPPLLAQSTFNTALNQAEANTLLYRTCDRERGRAQATVSAAEWNHIMKTANRVLLSNVDTAQLNAMLDQTSKGTSRTDQAVGEFQYCLIINKINLAELHERRAQR